MLRFDPKTKGCLRSAKNFSNSHLHVAWRWPKAAVSGMGLDLSGAPVLVNRKRAPRLAAPSEQPLGEWNTYAIFCRDAAIKVWINGVRQNRVDQLPASAGDFALQMEGCPVEFRNGWLEPL